MSKTNEILETPAKQSLLFFLKQILDDEHQEYMKYWANFNNDKKSSSISSLSIDHHRYHIPNETNKIYRQTPKTAPKEYVVLALLVTTHLRHPFPTS